MAVRPLLLSALSGAALAMAATLLSPAGSPGQSLSAGGDSRFAVEVRGAMTGRHTGRVVIGPAGGPGEGATYTISLGADRGAGVIVLTRLGGGPLRSGRFPVGESAALDSAGGFRALYLAGPATRPEGVFRAETGTLEISADGRGAVAGRLQFVGTGFLATDPDDETRRVHVVAAFGSARVP